MKGTDEYIVLLGQNNIVFMPGERSHTGANGFNLGRTNEYTFHRVWRAVQLSANIINKGIHLTAVGISLYRDIN